MRASGFGYLFREGARNLWTNRLMSVASVGVLVACLLLVGASAMFSLNVRHMMEYVEDQNEIVVFAEENADETTLREVENDLRRIDNIATLRLVTKEEALEQKKKEFGSDAFLLDEYSGGNNPLLDSFVLTLKDIETMDDTLEQIRLVKHTYSVSAAREVASAMVTLDRVVSVGGVILVAILIIVSAVVISNTIKLTVFNRRKEIYIMKYVGATDFFIKLPFVIEGILLGLISALISYLLLWAAYGWVYTRVSAGATTWFSAMFATILPFSAFALPLGLGFLAAGLCVGVFGSGMFVNRHLKV